MHLKSWWSPISILWKNWFYQDDILKNSALISTSCILGILKTHIARISYEFHIVWKNKKKCTSNFTSQRLSQQSLYFLRFRFLFFKFSVLFSNFSSTFDEKCWYSSKYGKTGTSGYDFKFQLNLIDLNPKTNSVDEKSCTTAQKTVANFIVIYKPRSRKHP